MEPVSFESQYPPKTRFEEIKKVVEILRSGRSAQVVALPGVGKSNILRLLTYNRGVREAHLGKDETHFHFVYMDFSEVRGRNLFEITKFILVSLAYSLGERTMKDEKNTINDLLKEALELGDELVLFQNLKKSMDYVVREKGWTVIFLFDKFETYVPNIDERFFLNLNVLRNRLKYSFMSVFAVARSMEDILEPEIFDDFYSFVVGNSVFLPVKDEISLAFRFSYLEKTTGKKADEKTKKEIERLTSGHGKLTRLAYERVLEENPKSDFEHFLLSQKSIQGALMEIWNFLIPSEKKELQSGEKSEFLERVGLVDKNGKVTIPLFAKYLSLTAPISPITQSLSYSSDRNEILKGEENLTEKLTPSEFRLLRFLLINQSRVCEKDEIIENVWKDTKSKEGVTDQALDQIIYRLRKKIEEDPNNPVFLQTIKGRGYKVTS